MIRSLALRFVFLGTLLVPTITLADNLLTINVSGEGVASYVPDMATYTTGVETRGKTARDAVVENTKTMNEVIRTIEGLGIPSKDIQTSQYEIYPNYESQKKADGTHTQIINGYIVRNTLTLLIKDIEKLGSILDQLSQSGANTGSNLEFGAQNYSKLFDDARRDAMRDAKKKAETLAQEAGVTLSGVQSISEQSYNTYPRPMMMQSKMMAAEDRSVPVLQGQQDVTVSVNVVYTFTSE